MYKFKIKSGMEEKFETSWEDVTIEFRDLHGGQGLCLHRDSDGLYLAYARWPNSSPWDKEKNIVNKLALNQMKECTVESYPAPLLKYSMIY